jgi:serine-type D-Ala-D-Ala carboxypeptidase (penicillin-binding protein 5/6)
LEKPSKNLIASHNETIVGKAEVYLNGRVVEEAPIYFEKVQKKEKKGLLNSIKEMFLSVIGVNVNG